MHEVSVEVHGGEDATSFDTSFPRQLARQSRMQRDLIISLSLAHLQGLVACLPTNSCPLLPAARLVRLQVAASDAEA